MFSCEKDDICAETTSTTPQLILRFYDILDQEDTKTVTDLIAYGLDDNNEVVVFDDLFITTTDSLVIPLRTEVNFTRIVLHKDYDIDDNGTPNDDTDDIVLGNTDVINVTYQREDVYLSRACGYKSVFNNIAVSIDSDISNWALNSEILIANITNENAAHVKIYH